MLISNDSCLRWRCARRPALIAGRVVSAGQWFAVLRATAMLIIDELSFTGNLLDALRYFVDQPRYDPW